MNKPDDLVNARLHSWIAPILDAKADEMATSRLMLNSAMLEYCLTKLSREERAEILGNYVARLAMQKCPTKNKR